MGTPSTSACVASIEMGAGAGAGAWGGAAAGSAGPAAVTAASKASRPRVAKDLRGQRYKMKSVA